MKKLSISMLMLIMAIAMMAQKQVTIKGGTIVPLESTATVKAADVNVGQTVDFKVSRDVVVDGVVAIPRGTIAKGTVYEAKRSTAFGTKGRLGIKARSLTLPSGENISFAASDIYIQGQNRTALSVVIFCFTLLPFPCGSKAVMPLGYEFDATVASNTTITIE